MKLIKMKCPQCGADLSVDVSKERAFCQYCGTQLIIDDDVQTVRIENAENLGYQFEKGRQRAEKENKRKGFPLVILLAALFTTIAVFMIITQLIKPVQSGASSSSGNKNDSAKEPVKPTPSSDSTAVVNMTDTESGFDNKMTVTELGEHRIPGASMFYFFAVKNDNEVNILIDGNATAYDAKGNKVDVSNLYRSIAAPGEEMLVSFYFSDQSKIDHIEYELIYSEPVVSNSITKDVSKEMTINDDSIIITITNNSDYTCVMQDAEILFRDPDGEIVEYRQSYFTGNDVEPGKTVSGKVECPAKGCKYYTSEGSMEVYYEFLRHIH